MSATPSISVAIARSVTMGKGGVRQLRRRLVGLIVAAAMLIALAIGGHEIATYNLDVPPLAELARDTEHLYGGSSALVRHLIHDHDASASVTKLAIVRVNGQVDARIVQYLALCFHAVAVGLLLTLLARALRLSTLGLVTLAAILVLAAPATSMLRPTAASLTTSVVAALSLIQLSFLSRRVQPLRCEAIGYTAGLLAIAAGSGGLASSVAAFAWGRPRRGGTWLSFFAWATLVALGAVLFQLRGSAGGAPSWLPALAQLASWPFPDPRGAAIVWLPALACVFAEVRAKSCHPGRRRLAILATWSFGAVAILAAVGVRRSDAVPALTLGLIVNAACCAAITARHGAARTRRFIGATIWTVLIGIALLPAAGNFLQRVNAANAQAAAVRAAIRQQDAAILESLPSAERDAAKKIVDAASSADWLPVSIRPPLTLTSGATNSAAAFLADHAPKIAEREDLPVIGTWTGQPPPRTGEFVSAPLRSRFPIIQVRIAGQLKPPATSVTLRAVSTAQETGPMVATITAAHRWRRVNFATPTGTFQLIARASSTTQWLALTAPIEMGELTRAVAKVPVSWPIWSLALGLFFAGPLTAFLIWRSGDALARDRRRTAEVEWRVVPWVGLFAYAVFFAYHLDPTAGPNDSGGYLNSAKLMYGGHVTAAPRSLSGVSFPNNDITPYLPITFHADHGRMVPEYPVGWPLEVAAAGKVFGLERGLRILMVLQLVLGVVATERLGRVLGLSAGWAWLAGGIVGLSPVYLFEALQPVSDGPALVWVTLAVYWAWLSRDRPRYAIFAGLATALAVMIRPSNVLSLVPLVVCFAGRWRQLGLWIVAGIPGGLWLGWYQQELYGSWHTTGYGDFLSGFGVKFIPLTLRSYAIWLPELLTPLVLFGWAMPFLRDVPARIRILLAGWIGVFIAFYAVYWCTWDNWYNMRFVMPAFPAMIIAAFLVLQRLTARCGLRLFAADAGLGMTIVSALVVVVSSGFVALRTASRDVTYWTWANDKPGDTSKWVRDHVPPNAVVFAKHMSGSIFYYTDLTLVRMDHAVARESLALYEQLQRAGRPIYAVTCFWETRGFRWEDGRNGTGYPDLPGTWDRIAVLGEGDMLVWKQRPIVAAKE